MKGKKGFEKGKSGNPGGRPRDGESLTALLNEYLKGTDPKTKKERRQILIEKIYGKAINGDRAALTYIFDRMDGKPGEHVKLTGEENSAIKLILEDARNKTEDPTSPE